MKALFTLLLITFSFASSFAQQATITGRVRDRQQAPVLFATVALLNAKDSVMVLAVRADEKGEYQMEAVRPGMYRVVATAVGFAKGRSEAFTLGAAGLRLPDLVLAAEAQALGDVEVVGRKQLLEMQAGKMVVNVAGSLTAGATALEALEKVPGLVVMNNRINLAGREGVIIQIDGRTTQYTDVVGVLKDFPSSSIARIEVLTQPGASHDAAGNVGIINIILNKNADLGTNGSLTLGAGYGRFGKASSTLDLNHRTKRVNVFGNYSYAHRKTYEQLNTVRNAEEAEGTYQQASYQPRTANVQTLRLGGDYSLTKRQTLGVLLNDYTNRTEIAGENQTEASTGARVQITNNTRRLTDSYAANLNYKVLLDTLGQELAADADYSRYQSDSYGRVVNEVSSESRRRVEQLRNDQLTDINLRSGKVDYRRTLAGGLKGALGVKTSQATIGSVVQLLGGQNERTDDFRYTESIRAGYAQVEGQHFGFSWQGGLRGEWTNTLAVSKADERTVARQYGQLFPSLNLDRTVYKNVGLNLAYSRRIDRPSYQDLNPSVVYLDPYTSQRGNSFLTPQFTNNYKLALTYNKQPFLLLGYSRTKDVISLVTATEDSVVYSTTANLDHLERYSATLNFPLNLGKLMTGYAGVNVFHNQYLSQYLGDTYRNGRTAATFYAQSNVKLAKGLSFEASGFYQTAGVNGLVNFRGFGALNLGMQKTLLHDRATLRLSLNDALFTSKQRGTVRYQDLDVSFLSYGESRQVRASFSYKLGNQQVKAARKRATGLDEERGRVKSDKE
ncbi:outer membrane beta-barrel protein [Hymenobacter arizonensis]|uniref:Outer membrane receptor proteins, mostly Fe transport n=1 Tax=Hymenobacter arizonensis TaxID=1227077 RepID=A0A1I6ABE0_HYMAR|nr:outer membrane beta-barrel protein [Hymenobacter arizonensis]SFQ65887.1 Outer membrane receptor proteins, mostly Fe transport [Hymenobacter arizonensis]